jgi:hypothetical protein
MKIRFADVFYVLVVLTFVTGKAQTNCPSFSTYFGGTQSDEIKSVIVDQNKNTYVLGNTYSADLPVTIGLINDSYSGSYDGFIAKFDSCGILLWSTYMGGSNFDSGEKMSLTKDGNLVFCGYTSSLNTFTTFGCFQSTHNGSYDCFITKINPSGHVIWSTLFGKSGGDFAYDLSVDISNHIIVGGTTTSTGLYTIAGTSFQVTLKGNTDAFIARFSPTGALRWSTYYGGNNSEDIHVVVTDAKCNVIGTGGSFSTNLNTSAGAFQGLNEGSVDGYVIKLDSNCARVFSSYIGGSNIDDVWGAVCDSNLNIYIAGHTNSTDFDTTAGAYQTFNKGFSDLYLTKWSPTGTLLLSTLFGGSLNDHLGRMIASGPYELTLAGKTESVDIPLLGSSTQSLIGGGYDVLLAKFNTLSLKPVWSTYYGGSSDEEAFDITNYDNSFMTFAGSTNSLNFPLSAAPYQATLNNSVDGLVTKLNLGNLVPTGISGAFPVLGLTVFPNPFRDVIRINSIEKEVLAVHFYDMNGHDRYADVKTGDLSVLHTASLPSGIYLLMVITTKGSRSFKLVR